MGLVGRKHVQLHKVNAAPIPGVMQAVFRHMIDQAALQSLGVALFELLLKTESKAFSAFRRAVVVSPTFEYGVFQAAVGAVQAEVGQEVPVLLLALVLAFPHPVAVVDDVAQQQHALRLADQAAAQFIRPGNRGDCVHLVDRDPVPFVAILVLERIVVRIRGDQEGDSGYRRPAADLRSARSGRRFASGAIGIV